MGTPSSVFGRTERGRHPRYGGVEGVVRPWRERPQKSRGRSLPLPPSHPSLWLPALRAQAVVAPVPGYLLDSKCIQ